MSGKKPFSSIRTITVGFGFTPNLLTPNIGRSRADGACWHRITAGGDFHPALRNRWHYTPRIWHVQAQLRPVARCGGGVRLICGLEHNRFIPVELRAGFSPATHGQPGLEAKVVQIGQPVPALFYWNLR